MMPEMDGYETLAAIKADEALRHLPVIMISGVDELDSVVRCIELGAADYLPKPFNPAILAARVRASLADKRLHDLEVAHAAAQAELLETIERQKEELQPLPLAAGRGARVEPGGRAAAGRPSPRGDGRLLRPARLHRVQRSAEPEEVLGVLREYHAAMGALIVEHGGTLEHFAGDGMMVFFNDPVPQPDHVERAVRMAVAMRETFGDAGRAAGRGSASSWASASASRPATPRSGGSASRAATTTAWSARRSSSPSRLSSAAEANQILLNPRAHAAVEGWSTSRRWASCSSRASRGRCRP